MSGRSMAGRLAKGQGSAFREALRGGRRAGEAAIEFVISDPRWDRQLEQRDGYYASLLERLGVPIDPIAERAVSTPNDPSDLWLCVDVLAQLAWRRVPAAVDAVNRGIACGPAWRQFFDALDALGGGQLIQEVVSMDAVGALLERSGVGEFEDVIRTVDAPWEDWSRSLPGLKFLLAGAEDAPETSQTMPLARMMHRLSPRKPPQVERSWDTARLVELGVEQPSARKRVTEALAERTGIKDRAFLAQLAEEGCPQERMVALRALAAQSCADFFATAVQFLRAQEAVPPGERSKDAILRAAYIRYLEDLPVEHTLAPAREWVHRAWPLSMVGDQVLARHASRDDRALVEGLCQGALASDDMYRVCLLVKALGAIGDPQSVPILLAVHDDAPYSLARDRALLVLKEMPRTERVEEVLSDALWDCESGTRADAVEAVSLTLDTRRRLREMAEDAFEDDEMRECAEERLG